MDDKKQLPYLEHLQSLEEAKEKINSMTNLVAMSRNRFLYDLGFYFEYVKELADREWKKWVKKNIELVCYETATHYMKHYRQCQEAGYLIEYNPTGHWKSRKNARVAFLKAGMPPELYTGNDERATTEEEAITNFVKDASLGGKKLSPNLAQKAWQALPEEEKAKYLKPPSDEEPEPESEEKTNEPEDDFPFPRDPWYHHKEYKLWSPRKAARAIIEKYGEVTRYRGMKEIVEVTKLVMWWIKRYCDNTQYWMEKYAKEQPVDIDSFEALSIRHQQSHEELERIWDKRHWEPAIDEKGKWPWEDPDYPGPLYTMKSGKIITTTEFDEYKKKYLPESESWSDEEVIRRWRIEQND